MSEIPTSAAQQTLKPLENLGVLPPQSSLYFNGFEVGLTSADLIMTLKLNNQRLVTCNCSFTTAKTLLSALRGTVETLEKATSHAIMTIYDVKAAEPKMAVMFKARREAEARVVGKLEKKPKNGGKAK
jgi:hypothetical protein